MTFSVQASIRYGWEAFRQRPRLFIVSSLIFIVLFFAIGVVATLVDGAVNGWPGFGTQNWDVPDESLPGTVVDLGLGALLNMGITAFYLKAVDTPEMVRIADFWHPQRFWSYVAASLITGLAVAVGLLLLIVPGVLLGLMYLFGTFVVIDRGFGPINALEESRRITKGHRWRLLGFVLLLMLIDLLGLLALGLGLLVTIPVTMLAFVYVYRLLLDAAGPSPYSSAVRDSELRSSG